MSKVKKIRSKKSKWIFGIVLTIVGVLLITEVVGRMMGFTSYPLYVESSEYEYVMAPNQNLTTFGNKVSTNEYSMRSKPLSSSDSLIVLLIGDSIINGGTLTDQDSLASSILEIELSKKLGKKVRVLNISAGSWGPDNGYAFVKKYGTFNAKLICLVVNSHDAHDNMVFEKEVGVNAQYPNKQFTFAIEKIIQKGVQFVKLRYFSETPSKKMAGDLGISKGMKFNVGFEQFRDLSRNKNIPLYIFLHSARSEVTSKVMEPDGKEIISFAKENNIPIFIELNSRQTDVSNYRDFIHYNEKGQKRLASVLYSKFLPYLATK
jgi:hypothetical protein